MAGSIGYGLPIVSNCGGRDDFNNPLVILFSTGALGRGISGVLLLFQAFRPPRWHDSCDRARAGAV